MSRCAILIVDDDPAFRSLLHAVVSEHGYGTFQAGSALEALEIVGREEISAALVDLRMPGMNGLELLRHLHARAPGMPVVILTAHADIPTAVQATRLGAYDYLLKPPPRDRLPLILAHLVEVSALRRKALQAGRVAIAPLIGNSPAMRKVLEMIRRVAAYDVPVLIQGESGTGKEVVACQIAASGARAGGPFVTVDCGALTETLVGSELFGHEEGSFTGAKASHVGFFQRAHGGTLFLDEVGNLSLAAQAKLLRLVQTGEVTPVGGRAPVRCDVRILAATNRDLRKGVESGEFREDLYHRLSVVRIELPPLREREGDIELLARFFLEKCAREFSRPYAPFGAGALERLETFPWPGNVRELENVVRHALLMAQDVVDLECLPPEILEAPSARGDTRIRTRARDAERETILQALRACGGKRAAAARRLGIDPKTLYNKIRKYGIVFEQTGRG